MSTSVTFVTFANEDQECECGPFSQGVRVEQGRVLSVASGQIIAIYHLNQGWLCAEDNEFYGAFYVQSSVNG